VLPTNSCEEPFEKGKEINLCIHPKKIALKRENKVADGNLNRIRGRIVSRTNNSNAFKVTVDIGGMVLHAAIPKGLFDFKIYENVWVCFAADAPHPLCGRRCTEPKIQRKCFNPNYS